MNAELSEIEQRVRAVARTEAEQAAKNHVNDLMRRFDAAVRLKCPLPGCHCEMTPSLVADWLAKALTEQTSKSHEQIAINQFLQDAREVRRAREERQP